MCSSDLAYPTNIVRKTPILKIKFESVSDFKTTFAMPQDPNAKHAGSCIGHCRAQRQALNYYCTEQYEKEKAAITSYEEGWDRWDGPIWPWRETNRSEAQDDEWAGCCNSPDEKVVIVTTPLAEEKRPQSVRTESSGSAHSTSSSLWHPRTERFCAACGRGEVPAHF